MAVIPPAFINAVSYSGETLRRDVAGLAAGGPTAAVSRTGLLDVRGMVVSLSGTSVRVEAGPCIISSDKGAYLTGTDSLTTIRNLTASNATNPRIDRVVLSILDSDNGITGGNKTGVLQVIDGTPAAVPGLPALPPLSIHLGQIRVPANGGTPVVTNDASFTAAQGAPIPVRNKFERDALPKWGGLMCLRMDLGWGLELWDGAKWVMPGAITHLRLNVYQDNYSTAGILWGAGTVAQFTASVDSTETKNRDVFTFPANDRVAVAEAGIWSASIATGFYSSDGVTAKVATGWIHIRRDSPTGELLGASTFSADQEVSAQASNFYLQAGGIVTFNYMTNVQVTAKNRIRLTRIA